MFEALLLATFVSRFSTHDESDRFNEKKKLIFFRSVMNMAKWKVYNS
jgi:hypothetical protein